MISPAYCQTMAQYNAWQNTQLIAAAKPLDDAARLQDRSAFFGSISGTLNHLLWGDCIWMNRFAGFPKPSKTSIADSPQETPDWFAYCQARTKTDTQISSWAANVTQAALEGELTWFSGAAGAEVSKPMAALVVHFFNHQTHHRGQIHAMLTAAGASPGDTDLFLMPAA